MRTPLAWATAMVALFLSVDQAAASLIFTQYHEGTGQNQWLEIYNTGPGSVDLAAGGFRIGIWTNSNSEGYKTNLTPNSVTVLTGTVAANSTFVVGNNAATTPTYAVANQTSTTLNFTGNDGIALYTGAVFATTNIVDAMGFTSPGNQGSSIGFGRVTFSAGFNTTAGSNITDFPTVWQSLTLASVNTATAGTNPRLGFFSPSAIPEPGTMALAACAVAGLALRRRAKSA